MIKVELIIKGTKGNVVIKGSTFGEVLKEYELNKLKIEKVLGEISIKGPVSKPIHKIVTTSTIQGRIVALAENDFFVNPKTATEVRTELKEKGYLYSIDRVRVALIRLVRRKVLRRLTEEREEKSVYVYVNP